MKSIKQFIGQSFFIFSLGLICLSLLSLIFFAEGIYQNNQRNIDEAAVKINMNMAFGLRNMRNNLFVAEEIAHEQIKNKRVDQNHVGKIFASTLYYNIAQFDIYFALSKAYSQSLIGHPKGQLLMVQRLVEPHYKQGDDIKNLDNNFNYNEFKTTLFQHDQYYKDPNESWYHDALLNNGEITYISPYYDKNYSKEFVMSITRAIYDKSSQLIGVVGIDSSIKHLQNVVAVFSDNFGVVVFEKAGGKIIASVPLHSYSIFPNKDVTDPMNSEKIKELSQNAKNKFAYKFINHSWIIYKKYPVSIFPWEIIIYQRLTTFYHNIIPFVIMLLVSFFVLLMSFLYFLRKNKRTLLPPISHLVDSLKQDAEFISHNKSFAGQYEKSNVLEINELTQCINQVFDVLNENFQNYSIEFEKNIKAKEALLKEETLARLEAEKSLKQRDDFLSIASHELRTPLTPLRMQIGLVKRNLKKIPSDWPGADVTISALENTDRQFELFLKLVDDLLDVTRISSDRFVMTEEEVNLSDLVEQTLINSQTEFLSAHCPLSYSIEPNIMATVDRTRMLQVLTNLLSNAKKYGLEKPIEVSLTKIKESNQYMAQLIVRDHGMGIAKENLEKIFERFERVAPVSKYGGLGLGLFITKNIINAHKGSIQVESTLNEGSIFTVKIPLR